MTSDLVLLDRVQGSVAKGALDSLARGDLPGISVVMIDGTIHLKHPPPAKIPTYVAARGSGDSRE